MKIINQNPTPPSQLVQVPGGVDDVIDKGLRKDKTKRYADASALASGLCQALGLAPDAKKWAQTDVAELARELSASKPPPAKAFNQASEPPARTPARAGAVSGGTGPISVVPGLAANPNMKLGIAVAALAVVAVVTALLLR
jgi:hypothetical protein